MSTITVLKLLNGEEYIGSFVKEEDDKIFIQDVAIVQMLPGNNGRINLGLIPFAPYAEETTFGIEKKHITTRFTPNVELLNNYNRIFGSGLVVAQTV